MSYDENADFDDANPPEESNNRTFLLVAGILGGLVLLALICLVGYFSLQTIPVSKMTRPRRHRPHNRLSPSRPD